MFGALIPFGDDQRLAFYFYSTRPIVLAFLLHYLWTNRKKQKNAILYFFIWILILAPIVRDLFNNDDIVLSIIWNNILKLCLCIILILDIIYNEVINNCTNVQC